MSLILEALRKSEAERRRGQAPDLFTELPPAVRHREVRLSPVAWVALAAIVLGAGAWLARGLWSSSARGDGPVTQTEGISHQPPRQRSTTRPAAVDTASRSARDTAARIAETDAAASEALPVAATPPAAPTTRPTAPENPVVTAQSRSAVPPPADAPERDPPSSEPHRVAAAVPVPAPVPTTPPATATPATPAPAAGATGTLELTHLTLEQRKQLPPLRMSMHMWDPDPARRFVIIDGARRGEGDRIGAAVVEQISADGVLLNWNGLRLRLSMR